jgi:hypothetical protein
LALSSGSDTARTLASSFFTCSASGSVRGGTKPRMPSMSRSGGVKPVPLFVSGSCTMPTPRLRVNCGARNAYAAGADVNDAAGDGGGGGGGGGGAPAGGDSEDDDGVEEDAQQRRAAVGDMAAAARARAAA